MEVHSPDIKTYRTPWNILIIDDDEDDYFITKEMLSEAKGRKYNVHWASSYEEGQKAIFNDGYQAVLVDYDLGLRSGIELIREANERENPIPLILFTGRGNYEVDVEAMQAGATMYLTKGEVNPLLLERAIRYAVERKQTEEALRQARDASRRQEERLHERNEALRQSEEKFARAFQYNPAAMTITRVADSSYTDANVSFCQMVGYSREEIIGHSSVELGFFSKTVREVIMREFGERGSVHQQETTVKTKSGAVRHVLFSLDPIEVGDEASILATMIDITDRKQAEESRAKIFTENKHQRELLQAIYDTDPGGIAVFTLHDLRFQFANPAYRSLLPTPGEDPVGKTIEEVWPESLGFQVMKTYLPPMEDGKPVNFDRITRRFPDGSLRHFSVHIHAIMWKGQPSNLVVVWEITQLEQAKEEARKSEERLLEFLENTHDNFIALDREWRFTYANRHYGEIMGVEPQELMGKNYWELYPQYLGTELERNYRKVMAEGAPIHYRQRGVYTNSLYEVSVYPTREGVTIFSIDRTEELRNQQQVEDERARLETVLQALPVGIWVTDPTGRILMKNEQSDRIWAGEAPLAKDIDQYREYPSWDAQSGKKLEPEEYPIAVALRTGQPVEPAEHRIRRFDGSEGTVLVSAQPILDREGQLAGVVAINMDITERKKVEDALRQSETELIANSTALQESEKKLRKLVEGNIIGINVRDAAGQIRDANSTFLNMIGYTCDDLEAGKLMIKDLTPPAYLDADETAIQEALATGSCKPYEKEYLHKDGHAIPAMVGYTRLDESDDSFIGYVLDLTELKQAQASLEEYAEKLERSNQELEQFAFIASHDLQEPLRKVKLFGNALQHKLEGKLDADTQDNFNRMINAVDRMQIMIQDLLQLSRVNTQGRPFVDVDLSQVAAEVVSDLETQIRRTHGQVIIGELPIIQADPIQIHQVLQNLIANGLKFHKADTPPVVQVSGEILRDRKNAGQKVLIQVEDNGIGFDEAYMEQIFQPFRRLHGRSEYEGTGIGLAIVKKIIDRHHGQITARSQPGAGAAFLVTLPLR